MIKDREFIYVLPFPAILGKEEILSYHILSTYTFNAGMIYQNSAEGGVAPAGAEVTAPTIRMWLLNKFISFLAVLSGKVIKIKTRII